MSRASTLARVQELKLLVLELMEADGLRGEVWAREGILAVAMRLEAMGRRLEAATSRAEGERFAPPPGLAGLAGQIDRREKQLPVGDRS